MVSTGILRKRLIAKQWQGNAGFKKIERKLQRRCATTMDHVKYRPPLPSESTYSETFKRREKMHIELIQGNAGFKKIEWKFQHHCASTRDHVKYRPPSPSESTYSETFKRRQKMLIELIPYMNEEELHFHSAKIQGHGNFQRNETELKQRCQKSGGVYKVTYEGPSKTELWPEIKVRRQRMHRKLKEYYRFQDMMALLQELNRSRLLTKIGLSFFNENMTVKCPLGEQKCPCRGVRHNHTFFTWRMTEDEYERRLGIWKSCPFCRNYYDPHEIESMDLLFQICADRKKKIEDCPSSHVSEVGEETNPTAPNFAVTDQMTYARIKAFLIPKIQKVIDRKEGLIPKINEVLIDITNGYVGIMDEIEMEVDKFILEKYIGDPVPPPPFSKNMWGTEYLLRSHIDEEEAMIKHGEGGRDSIIETN